MKRTESCLRSSQSTHQRHPAGIATRTAAPKFGSENDVVGGCWFPVKDGSENAANLLELESDSRAEGHGHLEAHRRKDCRCRLGKPAGHAELSGPPIHEFRQGDRIGCLRVAIHVNEWQRRCLISPQRLQQIARWSPLPSQTSEVVDWL